MKAHLENKPRSHWRVWLKRGLAAVAVFTIALWVGWLVLPRPDLYPSELSFSRRVFDRDGDLLHLTLTPDGKYRLPASLEAVSSHMIAATIAKEDRRYFAHGGVDARSIARAAWGVMSGQRLGGGSTLTMQYARLRYGLHTRSWWGKVVQSFHAVQLERHYSKRELLEAYLTLAPYGGNVEGVTAASLLWCGKAARDLSEREAAALSVIPQNPARRRPREAPNADIAAAQARLLAQLRGHSSPFDALFSLTPHAPVRKAPHLARRLLASSPTGDAHSSIDADQQELIERSMSEFLARWNDRGLRNASVILVHAPTREVRAYVGSAAFLDLAIHGQVDGVTARRSPGSALKPFIYALALDAGLIHPGTLLDDAPRQFGAYNPENSDRGFLGPLPAAEALRRSRNVPAVELLARLPGGGLDRFLRDSGIRLRRPPEDYGLSLALGGAEISLEELAMLYAALATDGEAKPLRFAPKIASNSQMSGSSPEVHAEGTQDGVESHGRTQTALGGGSSNSPRIQATSRHPDFLSPAARWLTLEALRDRSESVPHGLAWKTGTSHGFRDAWACGAVGEWVLCVWIGHFDAKPMQGHFARDTAAPLFFEIVNRLGLPAQTISPPPSITHVTLCGESGAIAAPCCPHTQVGHFIAGVSPITACDVHREVFLDDAGRQVRTGTPGTRRVFREFWPQHRLEQFRRAGLPRRDSPSSKIAAEHLNLTTPPVILSPQPSLTYVLPPRGAVHHRSIPLQASADAGVQRIHWFAGGQYLGAARPSESLLWSPKPGRWMLQASDDRGKTAAVTILVSHSPE